VWEQGRFSSNGSSNLQAGEPASEMHVLGAEVWRGDGDAAIINVDSKLYVEPWRKALMGHSSRITMVTAGLQPYAMT
jgi:hypothetical protein